MTDKEYLYKGAALLPKSPVGTVLSLAGILILCGCVFALERFIPAAWFFELAAIVFSAIYANKVLKQGTFSKTYILYDDILVETTRYGLIEKVTAQFELKDAVITDSEIICNGKKFSFYPDEALKKLLNL